MLVSFRRAFFSGVVLLAPLGITFFVFNWLVLKIGGSFKTKVFFFLPREIVSDPQMELFWNITATVLVVCLITLLGFLSRYFVAKYLWSIGERILHNLPVVNTVYTSVKQIIDTFSSENRTSSRRSSLSNSSGRQRDGIFDQPLERDSQQNGKANAECVRPDHPKPDKRLSCHASRG